jgi:hypothetical protein
MRSVMINDVAARMNFAGRGAKTGISSMKILKVIVGKRQAIRQHIICFRPLFLVTCVLVINARLD